MKKEKVYSWVKVRRLIPFRTLYMYWDKEPFLGDVEFEQEKINIHFLSKRKKKAKDDYYIVYATCWKKDQEKMEEALKRLSGRLARLDLNYPTYVALWKAGDTSILGTSQNKH